MTNIKFKIEMKRNVTQAVIRNVASTATKAVRDISQDYARTVSETTPHKTGDLAGSYAISYTGGLVTQGLVEFSAYKGGFNYAMSMHEWTYKLGEGSLRKGGGTGMSGTTYPVGNKFMTRVLAGEQQSYTDYLQKQLKDAIVRMG